MRHFPNSTLTAADGSEWQIDAADLSVGLDAAALYHDGPDTTQDCRTVESWLGRDGAYAKCSCGAVLEISRPEE